jgi:hypothetical protein
MAYVDPIYVEAKDDVGASLGAFLVVVVGWHAVYGYALDLMLARALYNLGTALHGGYVGVVAVAVAYGDDVSGLVDRVVLEPLIGRVGVGDYGEPIL